MAACRCGRNQAHFQIFDQVTAGQIDQCQVSPVDRHSRSHQLAGQPRSRPTAWPHQVLDPPGKLGDLDFQPRACRCTHQIEGLHWPPGTDATARQMINAALTHLTIGVDDNHHLRRRPGQMTHTTIQRVALATPLLIPTLHHFCANRTGQRGRVVVTVVGNHQQPVTFQQLRENAVERRHDARGFVVRGYQHRHARPRAVHLQPWSRRQAGQQHLREQHQHRQQRE